MIERQSTVKLLDEKSINCVKFLVYSALFCVSRWVNGGLFGNKFIAVLSRETAMNLIFFNL